MTKSNVMQPYWPWCRKEAAPGPQFFPVDEKLSISVAAVMGLQHALAMCGGIIVSTLPVSADPHLPAASACHSCGLVVDASASAHACLLPCQRLPKHTPSSACMCMCTPSVAASEAWSWAWLQPAAQVLCSALSAHVFYAVLSLPCWSPPYPAGPTLTASWLHCRRHPSWYLQQPRTFISSNVSTCVELCPG